MSIDMASGEGEDYPPVVNRLSDVYGSSAIEEADKRYAALKTAFTAKYGRSPDFFARAPGRVNIIGEHIDYHGYAVLPMAIEQDIVCAVATNSDGVIRLANISGEYQSFSKNVDEVVIDGVAWHNYFLCGWKGIVEHFSLSPSVGIDVVLDGCIPKSAGLSSSSALVCCAALVTLRANGKEMSKVDLANLCARSERFIGTMGGGMDQSISFLAEPGKAKLIEFNPLRATTSKLPSGVTFVISNSLTEINKAAPSSQFNVRVVEGRAAAQLIAKTHGLDWKDCRRLMDVQLGLKKSLEEMAELVKEELHEEPYSREELCTLLGISDDELLQTTLSSSTAGVMSFQLHDRAVHVYEEAARVHRCAGLASEGGDTANTLGRLMTASHFSCSKRYQCSSPELDELTQICRDCGALGSRLTGAGWGGCAVSAVPTDKVISFLTQVKDKFYSPNPDRLAVVEKALFATKPGSGAAFIIN